MLFFSLTSMSQKYDIEKEVKAVYTLLIDSVFCINNSYQTIVLYPLNSVKKINDVLTVHKIFWDIVETHFRVTDLRYIEEYIDSSPNINSNLIYSYMSSSNKKIIIDTAAIKSYESISKTRISYKNSLLCEVSNAIFTKDRQFCILFYHIFDSGATTMVFKKVSDKWIIFRSTPEWFE